MIRIIYYLLLSSAIIIQSCAQKRREFKILGEWQGVSRILMVDGDTVDHTLNQTGYKNNYVITFDTLSASILDTRAQSTYQVSYEVKDGILYFNDDQHPIEILNDSTLAYREVRNGNYKYFVRRFNRIN